MKLYLATTKEPIEFGDTIVLEHEFTHEYFGKINTKTEVVVSLSNYKALRDDNIIIVEEDKEESYDVIRKTVLKRMATRYKWDENRLVRILKAIDEVHPAASMQMVLKEIAMLLDEKYPGHISNVDELYVISLADGEIHPIERKHIKSFRNIAVFRCVGDAEIAQRILGDKLTSLFNGK